MVLSLAAGTVLDAGPERSIAAAAAAGFDAVGLRFTTPPSPADLRRLSRSLADGGLAVLDVEVVRLGGDPAVGVPVDVLVDAARALDAALLLVVSDLDDDERTAEELHAVCDRLGAGRLRAVLEPMAFTGVTTLEHAAAVIARADPPGRPGRPGRPGVRLLVDALHLARVGQEPADAAAHAGQVGCLQLCDAPAAPPPGGVAGLAREARHDRLLPGDGALPLVDLVRALPGVPVSVEVQSDRLAATTSPEERARLAHDAAAAVLRAAGAGEGLA